MPTVKETFDNMASRFRAEKAAGVNATIQSSTLTLTSLDGRIWDCTGGTIGNRYRPAACR